MFEIQSEFLFPKQVIISDDTEYSEYRSQLIEYCYEQMSKDRDGMHYTNVNGWQSDPLFMMKDPKLNFFLERLIKNVNQCLVNHYMIRDNVDTNVPRMWINISNKYSYNVVHTHPFSHYTGVFYVKTAEKCGDISLYQNSATEYQETLFRRQEIRKDKKICPSIVYEPIEGRLLLFPSTLSHGVDMNRSDSDRISISFDIVFS